MRGEGEHFGVWVGEVDVGVGVGVEMVWLPASWANKDTAERVRLDRWGT